MNRIHQMIARLRERFTDWSPETVTITPPPTTVAPKIVATDQKSTKAKLPPIWRLAEITNPKTGKPVVVELRKGGLLFTGDADRLGIAQAREWHEVRAPSRTEARKLISEGAAEKRTAS